MNRKKIRTTLCALLALAGLTAIASTASGGAGSQADPLVTLSYLTETFTGQVMERVDERIVQRNAALSAELGGAYAAVTLSAGQTLSGEAGCELLLRSGSAVCVADSAGVPGMVDATSGGSINHGAALQPNHLYLMTEAREVTASTAVTLLVRGPYTVG